MNRGKIIAGLIWRFGERITAQAVTLIVSIVLARLLAPADYGILSLVMIFITFSEVLINNGFGTALIQKKDADDTDFSTVFYFQLLFALALYALLYYISPAIGVFYNNAQIVPVLRVLGLRLIISAVNNVQHAYVSKHMLFRKFFWSTLFGTLLSAVVGVSMAYTGFGVWALVGQYLTNSIIDMVVLFVTIPWKPKAMFSFHRLSSMLSYSWNILINALFDTLYSQIRALVIGWKYSAEDLAYYNKGQQFPSIVENNINMTVESVLFPAIASIQDERERVKQLMRRSIRISSYVMCPLLIGLAVIAKPFVQLVLTEKWLPCVPYMQIYCIVLMFNPIHTSNIQAIKAIGRSDIVLKLNLVNKAFGILALLITYQYGPLYIAYSLLATTTIGLVVNTFPNRKLLGYGFLQQIGDIAPGILLSLVMAAPISLLTRFALNPTVQITLQVLLGGIIYIGASVIIRNETFLYVYGMLKEIIQKKKKN